VSPEQSLCATTLKEELIAKLQSRAAKVGVIGLGYIGLPIALLFTKRASGLPSSILDSTKLDMLTSLWSYICRIPPTEIALARDCGFQATRDFICLSEVDAIVICAPTPLTNIASQILLCDGDRQVDRAKLTSLPIDPA
jgi:UDP-N-acetyl-D-glucosamine dehydrogenase